MVDAIKEYTGVDFWKEMRRKKRMHLAKNMMLKSQRIWNLAILLMNFLNKK